MSVDYWMYVSKAKIDALDSEDILSELVKAARLKNELLRVTGALIFGGGHFGQIIEGPSDNLAILRSVILADERHTDVRTIAEGTTEFRRFEQWSLAYSGASMVVSRALQRALRDTAQGSLGAGAQLLQLMDEFATVSPS